MTLDRFEAACDGCGLIRRVRWYDDAALGLCDTCAAESGDVEEADRS